MRRSIAILSTLLVASGLVLAQKPGPKNKAKEPDPLPPLNARVEAFAKSHLGEPVGDGICITLAVEALNDAGAKRFPFARDGDYVWGEEVPDLKDALPGDILQFRDAVFQGKRSTGKGWVSWHHEYPHHTAIVARVEDKGRLITIYHQNVELAGRPKGEKGNVQKGELRMTSLQKGGWVKAYRPIPPDDDDSKADARPGRPSKPPADPMPPGDEPEPER